jgi:hypothetical protein
MKDKEKNTLTLEEAKTRLAELLVTLAQNAIYHNELIEEVKEIEEYIKSLEEKKKDE